MTAVSPLCQLTDMLQNKFDFNLFNFKYNITCITQPWGQNNSTVYKNGSASKTT